MFASSLGFVRIFSHLSVRDLTLLAMSGWTTFPITLLMAKRRRKLAGATLFCTNGVPGFTNGRIGHLHLEVGRGPKGK